MLYHRKALLFLVILACFFIPYEMLAQCPMCKMAAESNLENGGSAGIGLNKGILYMLTMPYFIIGIIGFIWYRNRKEVGPTEEIPTNK